MDHVIDGGRNSGRTYRQLEQLPDGAIFLVPNMKIAGYCRQLLRKMGREPTSIRFATVENFRRFEGASAPAFAVDHAFYDVVSRHCGMEAEHFLELTTQLWSDRPSA